MFLSLSPPLYGTMRTGKSGNDGDVDECVVTKAGSARRGRVGVHEDSSDVNRGDCERRQERCSEECGLDEDNAECGDGGDSCDCCHSCCFMVVFRHHSTWLRLVRSVA